jgi:hypothetical protein
MGSFDRMAGSDARMRLIYEKWPKTENNMDKQDG